MSAPWDGAAVSEHVAEHARRHALIAAAGSLALIVRDQDPAATSFRVVIHHSARGPLIVVPALAPSHRERAAPHLPALAEEPALLEGLCDEASIGQRADCYTVLIARALQWAGDYPDPSGATCDRSCDLWRDEDAGGPPSGPCPACGAAPGAACAPSCRNPPHHPPPPAPGAGRPAGPTIPPAGPGLPGPVPPRPTRTGNTAMTTTTATEDTQDATGEPLEPPQLQAQPTIALEWLRAHPGNVRPTDPDPDLLEHVKANGIRIPLLITLDPDVPGAARIIDGHQRFGVAEALGLEHVPYTFDAARADDLAGQYLDMISTARHRTPLTALQEATALFAASQHGASKQQLAKAVGGKRKRDAALAAAAMPEQVKSAATETAHAWTLDELAVLAEFADDPEVTDRLLRAAERGQFTFHAERARQERKLRAESAALRAKLEAAAVRVLDDDPPQGKALERLRGADGEDLDKKNHAACPGHAATVERYGRAVVTYWCQAPAAHGHTDKWGSSSAAKAPITPAQRKLVIEGNKSWKAALATRRAFLTALAARTGLPVEQSEAIARFVAQTLLTLPGPVLDPPLGEVRAVQAALLGIVAGSTPQWEAFALKANRTRLPLLTLVPIAACYEHAIRETVWRTDRSEWELGNRPHARRWLAFCEHLGHTLSPIERAVVENRPVTLAELSGESAPLGALHESAAALGAEDESDPAPESKRQQAVAADAP